MQEPNGNGVPVVSQKERHILMGETAEFKLA